MRIRKCKICAGDRSHNICGGCNNRKSVEEHAVNYLLFGVWILLGVAFYFVYKMTFSMDDDLSIAITWCYLIFTIGLMIGTLIQVVDNFKK